MNILEFLNSIKIFAPAHEKAPEKYHVDDSYNFLVEALKPLEGASEFQQCPGYLRLKAIRDLATDLMEVKTRIYACLRKFNLVGAVREVRSIGPKIEKMKKLIQQDFPDITDKTSFYCALLYAEYIRIRSGGYMLNEKGEWEADEAWTKKNVGIDLDKQRVELKEMYQSLREKIKTSLLANFLDNPEKAAARKKLEEQDNPPVDDSVNRMLSKIDKTVNRLKLQQFSTENHISQLESELKFYDALSTSLQSNEYLFEHLKAQGLKDLVVKDIEKIFGPTSENTNIQNILSLECNSSSMVKKVGTVVKNAVMGYSGATYAATVSKRIAQERKRVVATLKTKTEELKKIESLIDELTSIRNDLKWKLFSSEKVKQIKELVNSISSATNLEQYKTYVSRAEHILEVRRFSFPFWTGFSNKDVLPKSYNKFVEWEKAQPSDASPVAQKRK